MSKNRHSPAKVCARVLVVALAIASVADCLAGDRTITLKAPAAYSVPDNEIWKIADASVADGPSTDLEFKDARVYVGTGGTLDNTFFLLAGDFDVSLLKKSDLYFFVQPGSKLRVGQRGPLQATVITMER